MSATGFAIAFMFCSAPELCDLTALRAVRYQSLADCRAAIPEALLNARRGLSDGGLLAANCRKLAELCPATVASVQSRTSRPQPARSERWDIYKPAIAGVLALLCAPSPEQGC